MTVIADPIEGVVNYLRENVDLAQLVDSRVYGSEFPSSQVGANPRTKAVVVTAAGRGFGGAGFDRTDIPLQQVRVDLFCYGETPYQAARVMRAVAGAMKGVRGYTSSQGGAGIKSAVLTAGPIQLREPDTGWFVLVITAEVLAAE